VAQNVGDLVGTPAEVDRDADDAELRAGVVGDEELDAVPRRQGERVAAPVAPGKQSVPEPVDQAVERAVGQPPLAVDQRRPIGVAGGGPGQAVADVDALDEVALDLT
jgi:hypothetical protein